MNLVLSFKWSGLNEPNLLELRAQENSLSHQLISGPCVAIADSPFHTFLPIRIKTNKCTETINSESVVNMFWVFKKGTVGTFRPKRCVISSLSGHFLYLKQLFVCSSLVMLAAQKLHTSTLKSLSLQIWDSLLFQTAKSCFYQIDFLLSFSPLILPPAECDY